MYFHGIYQETAKKNGEKEGKNVADDAVQYINSHYSDLNLSVALVAEYLSVSPSGGSVKVCLSSENIS